MKDFSRKHLMMQYYSDLIKEYKILSAKYSLQPIHGWIWKFSRLRPSNFPSVRISQLAAMLSVAGGLFSKVTEVNDIRHLRELFEVSASEYWNDHYIFGKKSRNMTKKTGSQALIFCLLMQLFLSIFVYGRQGSSGYLRKSIYFPRKYQS